MNDHQNFFSLIQKVGCKGRYQTIMFAVLSLQWVVIGAIMLGPSFFFMQPSPDCSHLYNYSLAECKTYVCNQRPQLRKAYYKIQVLSLATQFGDPCQNSQLIAIFQSLIYAGCFMSNLLFSFSTDNYGRKFTLLVSWGNTVLGLFLVCIHFNKYVLGLGLFMMGLGIDQTENITIMLYFEQVQRKLGEVYSVITQAMFCVGGILLGILFYLLQSWRIIFVVLLFVPALICWLGVYYYFEQNQQFNCDKGIVTALQSLGRIASINGFTENPVNEYQIQAIYNRSQLIHKKEIFRITYKDVWTYRSLRYPTIFFGFVYASLNCLYYVPELIIDTIGLSIYQNQFYFGMAELLSFVAMYKYLETVSRRASGFPIFAIIIACNIGLNTLTISSSCRHSCTAQYVQVALICIARFFVSLYFTIASVFSTQAFPVIARGITGGISGLMSRTITILNPHLMKYCKDHKIDPILILIGFAIIGLVSLLPLKETLNIPLIQEIEQCENQTKQGIYDSVKNYQIQ